MGVLARFVYKMNRVWWSIARPVTVGVRVLLIRDEAILLVRHTYQDAWYLVGGGVRGGETSEQAIRREAVEEVGASLECLELFGVYTDFYEGKSDHVVVMSCTAFALDGSSDRREIESTDFFPVHSLPDGVSTGTQRIIEEYLGGSHPCVGFW
jgi:ADP-ribose pyrophosphatase YjhB (NUDIX family)